MYQNLELDKFANADADGPLVGDENSAAKCERFIAFYFGQELLCVRAESVAEIMHSILVAALPNAPWGIAGLAAVRGEVIAVVDPNELLGGSIERRSSGSKIVVLNSTDDRSQFGIPADRMHGMVMLPRAVSRSNNENGIFRQVKYEGKVYNLLGVEKLVAEIASHF